MTVTQLLPNKTIADQVTANLALAEMGLIHIVLLTFQRLRNSLLTKREDVSGASSKQ